MRTWQRSSKRARSPQAGFTLIEVLMATIVLGIGGVATFELMTVIARSNANVAAQIDGSALANKVLSEVADARFLGTAPADRDPGLAAGGPRTAHITGSSIVTVGNLNRDGTSVPAGAAPFQVSYEVIACDPLLDQLCAGRPWIDVLVTVQDGLAGGALRGRRIRMVTRKEVTPSMAGATEARGWSPPL